MQRVIALDTEFDRRTTYRPTLSIVQVKCSAHDEPKIYDVLGQGYDLNELVELLRDDSIVKVIHAARQDFESIYGRFGIVIRRWQQNIWALAMKLAIHNLLRNSAIRKL